MLAIKSVFKLMKAGISTGVLVAVSLLILPQKDALAACAPDPTVPLKCFCEDVADRLEEVDADTKNICKLNDVDKEKSSEEGLLGKNGIVKKVFNLMTWLVGLLAAVYLIVGGFKIIMSGGNSDSVASGRKMIIYALVGIVVVITSNVVINFVIGLVNNASK